MANGTRPLLLLLLPLSIGASFQAIPNATGDVLLRVSCPETLNDCHLLGSCYSSFEVCARLNGRTPRCAPVPRLVSGYRCQSETRRRLLATLPISINASIDRLSVEVKAVKKTFLSDSEPTTARAELLPGLVALPNASAPTEDSWRTLPFPLLFDFKVVLHCRQNRYGPLCRTRCGTSGCSTTSTSTSITTPTTPITPKQCRYNYCQNGGVCELDATGRERCACTNDFIGVRCEIRDWCRSAFCEHGGICRHASSGMAVCQCRQGWIGTRCEAKDPCSSNPCQNGATCVEDAQKATCKCQAAWIGLMCERANPCTKQPCRNGGNCSVEGNSFKCSCPDNAFGDVCQLVLRESLLDNKIFVILVSVGISLLIIITLFFGICLICRRSKRIDKQRATRLEASIRAQHRERRRVSDVYAEIDSENCYSDGSESDCTLETRVKGQRTRTRSTSAMFNSRATSCVSRDGDKTV